MYSSGGDDIDKNDAFKLSCRKGKLDVCRWLYTLGVDTHAYDDGAFVSSCESSRIEVAKWFYSLGGADIHAEDDFAFTSSCQKLWENPLIVIIAELCTYCTSML